MGHGPSSGAGEPSSEAVKNTGVRADASATRRRERPWTAALQSSSSGDRQKSLDGILFDERRFIADVQVNRLMEWNGTRHLRVATSTSARECF